MVGTNGSDPIRPLPDECIIQIFGLLPSERDRCVCSAVSKRWLLLQAGMRSSDFAARIPTSPRPNDRTIRLLMGDEANDATIAAMAVGMGCRGAVIDVCIAGSHPSVGMTDLGLKIIGKACPRLKYLTLLDSPWVSGKGLAFVADCCNGLERLEINNSPFIDDEGLVAIARACPNLTSLNLNSMPSIGNKSLHAFGMYSSNLQSLSLANCRLFTDEGVASILSRSLKLVKVELTSLPVRDGMLKAMGSFGKSIQRLCLEGLLGISQMGFHYIGEMAKLEFLSLKSCSGLDEAIFERDGHGFARLSQIVITNCDALSDEALLGLIDSAELLEDLQLEKCNNVTTEGLVGFFLNRRDSLKVLSLVECGGIKESKDLPCFRSNLLPKSHFMKSLTINKCKGFGGHFLGWLGRISLQVKHLALTELDLVTDEGIIELIHGMYHKTNLISVDLSGCKKISDMSVVTIAWAFGRKLRILTLDNCQKLTDLSVWAIAKFCSCLLELDLSRCLITDDSLQYIEMFCGNLDALSLQQCPSLSNRSIDVIKDSIWWCDLAS